MVITRQVKTGTNLFEIKVTNTWHNRLAYDAAQPEAQRKTWTINSPPARAPMEDAELVGPVVLHIGKVVDMDAK